MYWEKIAVNGRFFFSLWRRGETAVFAGYSLNLTMVLPLNETPLGEVKQSTI